MVYNPNIPNAGDFISLSQKDLLANFSAILNAFSENHVSMTNPTSGGQHVELTLQQQIADPTTLADECALYCKQGTDSQAQLFFRPANNANPIQLSYQSVVTAGDNQRSFIAGPFIIFFGRKNSIPKNGSSIVNLSPTVAQLMHVHINPTSNTYTPIGTKNSQLSLAALNYTTNSFQIFYNGNPGAPDPATIDAYYLAIGRL